MKSLIALVAVSLALSSSQTACAQGIFGLTPPRPGDLPVAAGRGNSADKHPTPRSYFYYVSSSSMRSILFNPYVTVPVSRVTYVYLPAASIPPAPSADVPRPRQEQEPGREVERIPPPRRAPEEPAVLPEAIAPGAPVSVFRPIRPEDRARVGALAKPEPAKLPPSPEPPPLPGAPAAPAEPKVASARHIESGREAFQAHQYSRAERSFRRAAEVFPQDPQAHFLLAQARFALGKYADAVAAIHAGMRLQPDWPYAPYRPRELYGAAGDDFSAALQRLAEALAKNPDDPVFVFLYAHQLWFDNRKEEARPLFQRAKTLTSEPRFSERFLQANPGSSGDDAVVELLPPGPRF